MRRIHLPLLWWLMSPVLLWAQKFTINGYVKDANTGEYLIGANVFNRVDYDGTATNTFGFYSLTLGQDSVMLVASYVGYEPMVLQFYHKRDTTIEFHLHPDKLLEEVVIEPKKRSEFMNQAK